MERKPSTNSVESIFKGINRHRYNFSHYLQRRAGQWNRRQKSLLIDSFLRGYIIGTPLIAKDTNGTLSIIDGVQRFSTIHEFLSDEFKLVGLDPLPTDGEEYLDLNGKKFSELPEDLREKINDFQVTMDVLYEWTYEELVDMFERCNSGKPLTRAQKLTVIFGEDLSRWFEKMMDKPFFKNSLSVAQVKAAEDRQTIIQVMMVLSGYDYKGFDNAKSVPEFIAWFKENPNEELMKDVEWLLDHSTIYTWDRMPKKKLVVPLILLASNKIGTDIGKSRAFQAWLPEFYKTLSEREDFLKYCRNATTSKENVDGRINYFLDQVDQLEPLNLTDDEVDALKEVFTTEEIMEDTDSETEE